MSRKPEALSPRSRTRQVARAIIGARLANLRSFEDALTAARDPDTVHDMRVATRRLRAALALYLPQTHRLDAEIKALADALGAVRDLHVQHAWLAEAAPRLAPLVGRELPARERALLVALHTWMAHTVPRLVLGLERADPPGRVSGHRVRGRIARRVRAVARGLAALDPARIDGARAHELRIEVKKLRYQLEAVQPAWGKRCTRALALLAPLQEALGDLHDADVRLALLERVSAPARLSRRVLGERARLAGELGAELTRWRDERVLAKLRRKLAG